MTSLSISIKDFAMQIPKCIWDEPGKVLYSGREAFVMVSPLYVLGVNPGRNPENHIHETVGNHTHQAMTELPANWSAY